MDIQSLWKTPGVPHTGWECDDVEDLGSPDHVCEMCRSQVCRYVHHMEHPDYPTTLKVGCVCAGHMEGDFDRARRREQLLKNKIKRQKAARVRWVDPQHWHRSNHGNYSKKAGGCLLGVYRRDGRWKLWGRVGYQQVWGQGSFESPQEGMMAWLQAMLKIEPAEVYTLAN